MSLLRSLKFGLILIFFGITSLHATNLKMEVKPLPTGANLTWSLVPESVYYDIYIDKDFVARLDDEVTSYTLSGLFQKNNYEVILAARTATNETLDFELVNFTTDSWKGVYRWVNTTDNDNNGMMKEFILKVTLTKDAKYGVHNEIWTYAEDKWRKIFPFGELTGNYGWLKFSGDSDMETTYRLNCSKFNISSFIPSKWKIDKIYLLNDYCGVDITTKAFGFEIQTSSTYTFKINDEGKKIIEFRNIGTGVAEMAMFHNPVGPEKGLFILVAE